MKLTQLDELKIQRAFIIKSQQLMIFIRHHLYRTYTFYGEISC